MTKNKILFVPDIHLQFHLMVDTINEQLNTGNFTEVVFMGDYFDLWNQTWNDYLYLNEIQVMTNFYNEWSEKVKLTYLLGNHDLPYITNVLEKYSNKTPEVIKAIKAFFQVVKPQIVYEFAKGKLASHAGVYDNSYIEPWMMEPIEDLFGEKVFYGLYNLQRQSDGPVWIRPDKLSIITDYSLLPEVTMQVIGHTPISSIKIKHGLILIDTYSIDSNYNKGGNGELLSYDKTNKQFEIIVNYDWETSLCQFDPTIF